MIAGGLLLPDPELSAAVETGLEQVEALLLESVKSDYPFVTETSRHLVVAGGKRFRPLLVLLAGRLGDPGSPAVVPTAVAIELTHLSTLYHDDVMDEATLRRGATAANARWTNTIAILTGDFLFARASELTASLGTEATRILARTIAVLCEGQIRETVGPAEGQDPVSHHLQVVAEKTASLVATSAHLGALLSGAPGQHVQAVTRYAEKIGTAFQLSDDLLDITSESPQSGKTPGTDLREGIKTLPVLLALAGEDPAPAAVRLRELLRSDLSNPRALAEALGLLRASEATARAREVLVGVAEAARAELSPIPDGPARRALASLCDVVVSRDA